MKIKVICKKPVKDFEKISYDMISKWCSNFNHTLISHSNDLDYYFDTFKYMKLEYINILNNLTDCDYVVYIDHYTLLIDNDFNIEDWLDNNRFMIVDEDKLCLNFMILENSESSTLFIKELANLDINPGLIDKKMKPFQIHTNVRLFLTENIKRIININPVFDNIYTYLKSYNNSHFAHFHRTSDNDLCVIYKYILHTIGVNKYSDIENLLSIQRNSKNLSDYEVFNPNKDIALITYYTPNIADEGYEGEINLRNYCKKHDYTLHIHRKRLDDNVHPVYDKPSFIREHLRNHKYVVWVDSDIIITNQDINLSHILTASKEANLICFTDRICKVNSGFLIFKNSDFSDRLIQNWDNLCKILDCKDFWDYESDQGVLIRLLNSIDFKSIHLYDLSVANTPTHFHKPDSLMKHYIDIKHFRMILMRNDNVNLGIVG